MSGPDAVLEHRAGPCERQDCSMAPAARVFTDKSLPPEGRTLGEIVERIVSREAWDYLTVMVGDRHPPGGGSRQLVYFKIAPQALTRLNPDDMRSNAIRACLPLLDRWNSGVWIAKGRRGGPLEPPVEIPPPATGYQLVVGSLTRSVIFEPRSNYYKRIYDLRFYPAMPAPKPLPAHYREIRAMADIAFPEGWIDRRQVEVLHGVGQQFVKLKKPVPERQMMLRALGFRRD
jgi:hypothetical protein